MSQAIRIIRRGTAVTRPDAVAFVHWFGPLPSEELLLYDRGICWFEGGSLRIGVRHYGKGAHKPGVTTLLEIPDLCRRLLEPLTRHRWLAAMIWREGVPIEDMTNDDVGLMMCTFVKRP